MKNNLIYLSILISICSCGMNKNSKSMFKITKEDQYFIDMKKICKNFDHQNYKGAHNKSRSVYKSHYTVPKTTTYQYVRLANSDKFLEIKELYIKDYPLKKLKQYKFSGFNLMHISCYYMPDNINLLKLLLKKGFDFEDLTPSYSYEKGENYSKYIGSYNPYDDYVSKVFTIYEFQVPFFMGKCTPLHIAAHCCDLPILKFLVQKEKEMADSIFSFFNKRKRHIHDKSDYGFNLLHHACLGRYDNPEKIKWIIKELKIPVYEQTANGFNVMDLAIRGGNLNIYKYLKSLNILESNNILKKACTSQNLDLVRYFVEEEKIIPNQDHYDDYKIALMSENKNIANYLKMHFYFFNPIENKKCLSYKLDPQIFFYDKGNMISKTTLINEAFEKWRIFEKPFSRQKNIKKIIIDDYSKFESFPQKGDSYPYL
ncbi:MAG: ankyrin repeat domain-containing protein [Bacteroidetes bacterium]|nr:ankyrin repeat domain-containing protein [Bacteroidota bacterium]